MDLLLYAQYMDDYSEKSISQLDACSILHISISTCWVATVASQVVAHLDPFVLQCQFPHMVNTQNEIMNDHGSLGH